MELSICIVSYECRDGLRACLESIRANRPTVEHETVVVDNASTDGTVEMLRSEFYWVKLITNEANRGYSAACNQAVGAAQGKVLVMLNPDAQVEHGSLDALLRFVKERPWIGAVGPRLSTGSGEPELSCREFPTLMNALWSLTGLARRYSSSRVFGHLDMSWWDHSQPRAVDWLSAAALVFTRTAWEKAGPLDEGYFLQGAEMDWQKRLARQGLERWYLPTAQVRHTPARHWDTPEPGLRLPVYRAVIRYFAKHHGPLSSLTLRAMVLLTSVAKGVGWLLAALAPGGRARALARVRLHGGLILVALGPTGRK
jgi:GT2 family glycosyltransferase